MAGTQGTMRRRAAAAMAVVCALVLLVPAGVRADTLVARESQVIAALIYKCAMFVEWPEHTFEGGGDAFRICTLGEDSMGRAMEMLEGKDLKGRPLQVVSAVGIGDVGECQVLYVSQHMEDELPAILAAHTSRGVLLVSDMQGFAERGGMLQFYRQGDKVRFKINVESSRRAGLRISSKLLRLATIVGGR